jgi:hypothetical protein
LGWSIDESKTDLGVLSAPAPRPERVEERLKFAAVCWHLGAQKRRALAPLRGVGAGKVVEQCSQVRVWRTAPAVLVAVDTMVPCEQERPHTA